MQQGTVRWFDADRGFGFLAPDDGSADLFVHASEVVSDSGTRLLREGQAVEYEVGEGDRGPQARRVRATRVTGPYPAACALGSVSSFSPGNGER